MAESKDELKILLMKMKEESEKAGLKLNIQRTKIMATGPITSWQIEGEKVETVAHFLSLGSKITGDSSWSRKIKRHLFLPGKSHGQRSLVSYSSWDHKDLDMTKVIARVHVSLG